MRQGMMVDAALERRRRPVVGGVALVGAVLVAIWSLNLLCAVCERLRLFHDGTAVYRRAQWASTTALVALFALAVPLATWFAVRGLRWTLGLPTSTDGPGRVAWAVVRVLVAAPVLPWLTFWASDELFIRGDRRAPAAALGLGLFVAALFAADAYRLVRDAIEALRARRLIMQAPYVELDRLPAAGRVRTRGRIVTDRPLAGVPARAPLIYKAHAEGVQVVPEARIERDGAAAVLELDPARLVVAAPWYSDAPTFVEAGREVEVVAEIAGAADAYRSGPARLHAGGGFVYLMAAQRDAAPRLLQAAFTDLLLAGVLLLAPLEVLAVWSWAGHCAGLL